MRVIQQGDQVGHMRGPVGGIRLQHVGQDRTHVLWHAVETGDLAACVHRLDHRRPHVDRLAAQRRRDQQAQPVDVRPGADVAAEMAQLLWRDILELARQLAVQRVLGHLGGFRDAEVDQHRPRHVAIAQHHVVRRKVAVDHVHVVRPLQPRRDLAHQVTRLGTGQRALLPHEIRQRHAVDELHDQAEPVQVGVADKVVIPHDGLIREPAEHLGLAHEKRRDLGIVGEALQDDLDRHRVAGKGVRPAKDLAHAARADELLDLVIVVDDRADRHRIIGVQRGRRRQRRRRGRIRRTGLGHHRAVAIGTDQGRLVVVHGGGRRWGDLCPVLGRGHGLFRLIRLCRRLGLKLGVHGIRHGLCRHAGRVQHLVNRRNGFFGRRDDRLGRNRHGIVGHKGIVLRRLRRLRRLGRAAANDGLVVFGHIVGHCAPLTRPGQGLSIAPRRR